MAAPEEEILGIFQGTDVDVLEGLLYAEDRLKFLDENFSKSEEAYWFYRILTLQKHFGCSLVTSAKSLAGCLDKVKKVDDVKDSKNIQDLLLRQALINFEKSTNPVKRQTLLALKELIGLDLDSQAAGGSSSAKKAKEPKSTLNLDTQTLLTKTWTQFNLDKRDDIQNVFTSASVPFMANQKLNAIQTTDFLDLIEDESPEVPYLLTYIQKDLKENPTKFGDKTIHYRLTKEHLDLLGKTPQWRISEVYMKCYAWKLRKVTDVSYEYDLKALAVHLDALKKFADNTLAKEPKFNSLRAIIIYNWLIFQEETKGVYDKRAIKTYMKIPKDSEYCMELYANANPRSKADLDYEVDLIKELYPIGDDAPYVRRALRHIFQNSDDNTSKWKDVIDSGYLRKLYCEVKLMKGQGKAAELRRGYSKFGKYAYQELCQQVNIEILRNNKVYHSVEDPVSLTLLLKNVPELEVRIYQIDCKEYFLRFKDRVNLDIPLDGLAPNFVIQKNWDETPLLQRTRKIDLPQLRGKRGVFLIEFFGNGMKTRGLIRKGELRYIKHQEFREGGNGSGLGYLFRVFNELNAPVQTPEVLMDGKRYVSTSEDGLVFVPFAEYDQKNCPMIIEDLDNPGSATIHFINYQTENYRLECGMFVDRESLLETQQAKLIVRPTLLLNEMPVSVENLKNVQISIETTDAQGFVHKHVEKLQFVDNEETIETFTVPTELRSVKFNLQCQVFSLSSGENITLENEETFEINDIDSANALADLHLIPLGSCGYVLAVLGKNGEPYKGVDVSVELTHRYFTNKLEYKLRTNADGQIVLGRLPDISVLEAVADSVLVYQGTTEDHKHTWHLCHDQVNVPSIVNVTKGTTVRIPFMSSEGNPKVDVYDFDFVKQYKQVHYRNGYIEIKSLPGGIFQAFIRDSQSANVIIHVSKGDVFDKHAVNDNRIIELSEERPLQITEVKGTRDDGYRVQLQGFNEGTRVHVFVTHLVPRFSCYSFLASPEISPSVIDYQAYPGLYGDLESVSDEFQYIAARKSCNKFSGNMLERPTLLTKKWTTEAPVKQRRPPKDEFDEDDDLFKAAAERYKRIAKYDSSIHKVNFDSSNLQFLAEPSRVHCNYPVDRNGGVTIPAEAIADFHNMLQIVAVDDDNTCLRNVMLNSSSAQAYKDCRLLNVLDPAVHWTEKREIVEMRNAGETMRIENFATSSIETYDDISDVFELFNVLGSDNRLMNFKFLTVWNEYDMEKKLSMYDQYMCNEVNYYLFRKDRAFFDAVVVPLLTSKVQKGFMDLYLLERDLSAFCAVIKYQSLNTLERILLASRIEELAEPTLKYLSDAVSSGLEIPQESSALFDACHEAKQKSADDSDDWYGRHYSTFQPSFEKVASIIDQTREFQETRYYRVTFEHQTADLVEPSRFWLDYAKFLLSNEGDHFLSRHFHTPTKNLAQMLLALAALDLPFRSEVTDATLNYISGTSAVDMTVHQSTLVLSKQIKETEVQTSALSVSTNYFDPVDRFEVVDFEKQDKFLAMPLITHKVYGCRVVITNVSSMSHTVELLNQIPQGAIPVKDGFRTKNVVEKLEPYTTVFREFFFYFPEAGDYTHFQTRVSKNGRVIGFGLENPNIQVVSPETIVDTSSWEYFSMQAERDELLSFLTDSPRVHQVELSKVAYRMEDEQMFIAVTTILRDRQIFNEAIWSYSLKHFSMVEVKEYLSMQPKFLELIAPDLDSSVLTDYDAFARQAYQIMEYWPLTSPRAHYQEFNNDFFAAQYLEYLKRSFYRSYSVESMTPADQMTGVYYFLIQNRIEDALQLLEKIDEGAAQELSAFTYDYLRAYLSFYSQDVTEISSAQALCDAYLEKPLPPSKRQMWQNVADYLSELKDTEFGDSHFDPTSEADIRAARSRKLECEVNEDRTLTVSYKNIGAVELNFYQTDIELQFSTAPFRQEHSAFNFVAPTETMQVELDASQRSSTVPLPASLHDKSSVIEVIGGGFNFSIPNYDNELRIQISERLQQIRVFNKNSNKAIAKAYVKVYAQTPDAPEGRFLKDGYTDLRGRFDYVTVSTDEFKFIKALAILVLTDSAGSDVLEVSMA